MSEPLLTVDLGNTLCKLRLWSGPEQDPERPRRAGEIPSRPGFCADVAEWVRVGPVPGAAAICSVARPERDDELVEVLEPLVSGPLLAPPDHGLEIACRDPHTVGADRLFAALGALELVGGSLLVVDAGTALTVDAVERPASGPPRFLGGAIAPGPRLLARALELGAARLPAVEPEPEVRALGRSTREAMLAGVAHGFRGAARELVERVSAEAGLEDAPVVVTGGARHFLGPHGRIAGRDVRELHEAVHLGLRVALRAERNADRGGP